MSISFDEQTNCLKVSGQEDIEKIIKQIEQIIYLLYAESIKNQALVRVLKKEYGMDEERIKELMDNINDVALGESEEARTARLSFYKGIISTIH